MQFLRDWFDTIEGWAFGLAIVWLLLIHLAGFPETLTLPGAAGAVGPGHLIAFGIFPVLAKLRSPSSTTRPFKPVTTPATFDAGPQRLLAFLLLAGCTAALLLPLRATADEADVLRWDPKRLSVGVTGWGVVDGIDGKGPATSTFDVDAYTNWNLSRRLNVFAGADRDFGLSLDQLKAGGSAQVYGDRPTDRLHLFIGAFHVSYRGAGASAFAHRESWQAYTQGGWTLAETRAGRKWLFLELSARYDPQNRWPFAKGGLRVQPLGGAR